MKYKILGLAVAVAALWAAPKSYQQTPDTRAVPGKSSKKIGDVNNFPAVEFSATEPTDAKRRARGEKHNKSHWGVNPNATGDTTVSVDRIDFNLPALPIEKATAIVIGTIANAQAYLSNDKTGVYSSFVVSVDEVLKTPGNLTVGASIEVEREGGRVRFPSGRVHLYMVSEQEMPRIGGRYILFLAATDTPAVFEIITGYEIRDSAVYALDDLPQHRSRENVPAADFLNDLKTKLMSR
jgi:hypothetical protein